MAIRAAADGISVCLYSRLLAEQELSSGQLVTVPGMMCDHAHLSTQAGGPNDDGAAFALAGKLSAGRLAC